MIYRKIRSVYLCLVSVILLSSQAATLQAQTMAGDVRVSANWDNIRLDSALNTLASRSGFRIAYSSDRINTAQRITLHVQNEPLSVVLQKLTASVNSHFLIRGNRILLIPGKMQETSLHSDRPSLPYRIHGFVRDNGNGEALIGATVTADDGQTGTITNDYGFYSLALPPGKHLLHISYIGYKPVTKEIPVLSDLAVNFPLSADTALLKEVRVTINRDQSLLEQAKGSVSLTPSVVRSLPSFFGEHDVIKALETVPGIQMFGDGSTFFYVRGGNRDQNLVLLDDAPLFNPSHLLGLFSTVTPEAVKEIRVFRGPFPASTGGRLSSVIDIRTRDGNMQKMTTEGTVGLISAKLSLQGPLIKERSSFFLSARRSWFDWFFRQQNPLLDKLRFFDFNGKANYVLNQNNRLYISGYAGRDIFRQGQSSGNSSGIQWQNVSGSIKWYHVFGSRLFLNTTLAASSYDYNLYTSFEDKISWHSHISSITLKSDLSFYINPDHTLQTGVWTGGFNFNPGNFTLQKQIISPPENLVPIRNTFSYGAYLRHEMTHGNFRLDYGLRLSGWANAGATWEYFYNDQHQITEKKYYPAGKLYHNELNLEPRIALQLKTGRGYFETGYSFTAQYMQMITNSVSPFTALEVWLPSGPSLLPLKGHLISAGYQYPFTQGYDLSVNGWLKKIIHQTDYTDHARMLLNPALEGELRTGNGRAGGIEVLLQKNRGRLRGSLSYTLSKVVFDIEGINDSQPYPASYDRPHAFLLQSSYKIGQRWTLAAQWQFRSGMPFSAPAGFYNYRGYSVPYYDSKNNDRLPPYQRLDLSVNFKLNAPGKKFTHDLTLSLFNFYGQRNPWEINFNKILLDDGQIIVPSNYYVPPGIISTQIYVFRSIPSLNYHFRF